jgi:hypothetical protein
MDPSLLNSSWGYIVIGGGKVQFDDKVLVDSQRIQFCFGLYHTCSFVEAPSGTIVVL